MGNGQKDSCLWVWFQPPPNAFFLVPGGPCFGPLETSRMNHCPIITEKSMLSNLAIIDVHVEKPDVSRYKSCVASLLPCTQGKACLCISE